MTDEERNEVLDEGFEYAAKLLDKLAERWLTRLPMDKRESLNCKQYAKAIRALKRKQ